MTTAHAHAHADKANALAYGFESFVRRAVLLVAIAFFGAEALMTFVFGWREYHLVIGLLMVGIAVFAAYLCIRMCQPIGWTWRAVGVRGGYMAPWVVCFAVCQFAGWNVLGTMLADGGATRANKATAQAVAGDSLESKRAQLKSARLAAARTPEQVEAEIDAALKKLMKSGQTIGQATRDCADPGPAPTTCRQVVELRRDLVDARLKVQLEGEVAGGAKGLGEGRATTEGNWHLRAVARFSGADSKEVNFWWVLLFTLVIGAISNFGFVAAGIGQQARPPDPTTITHEDFFRAIGYRPAGPALPPPSARSEQTFRDPAWEDPRPHTPAYPSSPHAAPASSLGAPASHAAYGAPAYHGAPINITLAPAAAGPSVPGVGLVPMPAATSGLPPAGAPPAPLPQTAGSALAGATPAIVPVDRDHVKAAVDQLLTFKAACLVEAPGESVTLEDLFNRYVAWSKGRGLDSAAFGSLFPPVTGASVVLLGGAAQLSGLKLRRMPALQAVG